MARKIQLQSNRPKGAKSFAGLLGNAIFWLVVAIVLPVRAITDLFPEFAPYAPFAPAFLCSSDRERFELSIPV